MASSDPAAARSGRRPALLWAVVVVGALVGLGVAAVPLVAPEDRSTTADLGHVVAGLALLSGPVALWLRWLAPRRPGTAVTAERSDAGPVLVVRLRPHLVLGSLVVGAAWCALLAWGGLAIGVDDGGWALLLLALLPAALVPDAARGAVHGGRLLLDADTLVLDGFGSTARVAWDDVAAVDVTGAGLPVLRVQVRPGAASWAVERRRWLVDHDRLPRPRAGDAPALDVPLPVLDAPDGVGLLLQDLRLRARDGRTDRLRAAAAELERGEHGAARR